MIQQMIDGLRAEFDLLHIRMAYSDSVVSAGKFSFLKVRHLFDLIRNTRRALKKHPGAVLYYPPASPNLIPVLRDIIYLLAIRPLVGKIVFHFHAGGVSNFCHRCFWLKPLALRAYGRADIAVELGESCPRDGEFFKANQSVHVPYGVNAPANQNVRHSGRKGKSCLKILYVGIHTESKGLFDLLATAKELKTRGVPFEIRTAGLWYTEEEHIRFRKLQVEWGLEEVVQACGQKTGEDLWALYRWADVFFFPTFYPWETFGIVQLEAMASSLPVVASDWQGPKDVVLDGETGFLCPAHDIESFANALQSLVEIDGLCERLGLAGRKRYEQSFTADCFVENMKNVFREITV